MNLSSCGEILTLQFGHYSNFVGTHWWNIQERGFEYSDTGGSQDIKHDVLYREGMNNKEQVTFTPRALVVDLKGSLRAASELSELYEDVCEPSNIDVEWDSSKVDMRQENRHLRNQFQEDIAEQGCSQDNVEYNFEQNAKVWSDYLYARFHPRTINIVKDYQQENSVFNIFPQGRELWKCEQFQEEFSDKIRNYIEECDYFQGYQILFDAVDGFSGLASACMEHLRDEYGRALIAFPLIPSFYADYKFKNDEEQYQSLIKDSLRIINMSFCFDNLRNECSLFVPLCTGQDGWRQPGVKRDFYHLKYNPELYYHSAAILASAIDTITLRYRLKSGGYSIRDLGRDMNCYGRVAAAASLCLPFSLNCDSELIDCLDNWTGSLTQTITPNCFLGKYHLIQQYTLRGIPETRLKKPVAVAGPQKDLPAYKCESVCEMLEFYLSCNTFNSINRVTVVDSPLTVKTPYPKLFDEFVGQDGNIIASPRPPPREVESVPVMAALHTSTSVGDMIETLHTATNKVKFRNFHQFREAGISADDFSECMDNLLDFRECYEFNHHL